MGCMSVEEFFDSLHRIGDIVYKCGNNVEDFDMGYECASTGSFVKADDVIVLSKDEYRIKDDPYWSKYNNTDKFDVIKVGR